MASQWAAKRKFVYGSVTIVVLAVAIGVPLYFLLHKKPSCFDGKQNQNEKDVDCGGICTRLCLSDISAPIVLWQRSFEVSPGVYSAVAYIQNPNVLAKIDDVGYVFRLYDKDNVLISERSGRTFLPANQTFAVFEAGLKTGSRAPVRTVFEFTESPKWSQNSADYKEPSVLAENITLTDEDTSPRIDAVIHNRSLGTIKTLGVVAIIYDAQDNSIAASRTLVEDLSGQSSVPVTFTWPGPFSGPAVRKEIMLRIYPAGVSI